jgi:hypothetical protein
LTSRTLSPFFKLTHHLVEALLEFSFELVFIEIVDPTLHFCFCFAAEYKASFRVEPIKFAVFPSLRLGAVLVILPKLFKWNCICNLSIARRCFVILSQVLAKYHGMTSQHLLSFGLGRGVFHFDDVVS